MSPLLRDVKGEINNQPEPDFRARRGKFRAPKAEGTNSVEFSFQKSQSWANIKTRQLQLQVGSERRRDGGGKGDRGLKKERKKEVYYHYQ